MAVTIFFGQILNMSLTASIIILLVMAVRLLLKRSPKIYSYALWAVVLFRLLCPISIASELSVLELTQPKVSQAANVSYVSYAPVEEVLIAGGDMAPPAQETPIPIQELEPQAEKTPSVMEVISWCYLAGAAVMILSSLVSYLRLYRDLVGAVRWKSNIYLADHIASPFVLGTLFPKIYLPSNTPMAERRYIVAHERHHIRRCDHVIKLLAYAALCLHWFNPLVWVAFVLAGKDMEMSCDEAVIKKLGEHIRADYSASLLRFATHRTIIAGTPLAFGEGDTKGRVMNMAKWRKPKVWVSILCGALCILILAVCALNPKEEQSLAEMTRTTSEGPTGCAYGELHYTLPGGITHELREIPEEQYKEEYKKVRRGEQARNLQNTFWSVDGVEIGGITDYLMPEGCTIANMRFVDFLDLWELKDDSLGQSGGGSVYADYQMEFFTDVAPGTPIDPVRREHYFYFSEDCTRIYDIWFDLLTVDPNVMEAILKSANIREALPVETEAPSMFYENAINVVIVGRTSDSNPPMAENTILLTLPADGRAVTMASILKDTYLYLPDYQNHVTGNNTFSACYPLGFSWGGGSKGGMEMINLCLMDSFGIDVYFNLEVTEQDLVELVDAVGGITINITEEDAALLPNIDSGLQKLDGTKTLAYLQIKSAADEAAENAEVSPAHLVLASIARGLENLDRQHAAELLLPLFVSVNGAEITTADVENILSRFIGRTLESCTLPFAGTYSQQQMEINGVLRDVLVVHDGNSPTKQTLRETNGLNTCRTVLQQIQGNSAYKITTQRTNGPEALNPTSTFTEWGYGDNRLAFNRIPESGGESMFGGLFWDGLSYECDSQQTWSKVDHWTWQDPWLSSYQWNEENVTYLETVEDEGETTILLRIEEPYGGDVKNGTQYFVSFRFDARGAFQFVTVQAFLENMSILETESVVTLNPDTVWSEMAEEVRRATGKEVVRGENVTTDTLLYQSEDGTQAVVISTNEAGSTVFRSDSQIIGGITSYPIPEGVYDPEDESWDWLKEVGIPDYEDDTLFGSYLNFHNTGFWSVTFSREEAPAVRRDHTFYVKDGHVIDLWFDMLQIDHEFSQALRSAAKAAYGLNETPVQEAPVMEDSTLYLKTFESSDGTVTVNINTWIPNAVEAHGLSIENLQSIIEEKLHSKSVDGFGLDTAAMGYEGAHCHVRITDIKPGSDYLVAANTAVPTIEVWGTRTYTFGNGEQMGDDQDAIQLLLLNARDGSILVSFGEKN